jgi:probable HAF family extracellular repeat protein
VRTRSLLVVAGLVCARGVPTAFAQTFLPLGTLPGGESSAATGVSDDGRTVVGISYRPLAQPATAFRWSAKEGMAPLEPPLPNGQSSFAAAISADASVAAGWCEYTNAFPQAGVWRDGGFVPIGYLPARDRTHAQNISGDGSVVVGVAGEFDFNSRAVRWSQETGIEDLGTLPGHSIALAYAANHDGSVVVGVSAIYFHIARYPFEAFRWTRKTGMVGLGGLRSQAFGVSTDGEHIVGTAYVPGLGGSAVRWTAGEPMLPLDSLPRRFSYSVALDVSDDGSVIVGQAYVAAESHAVLWTPGSGLIDLNALLPALGVDLTGWVLAKANAVTPDGRVVVGYGVYRGHWQAWRVDLGATCRADFNADGALDSRDLFEFLPAFFAADPRADFNADARVDSSDLFEFLAVFFAGC